MTNGLKVLAVLAFATSSVFPAHAQESGERLSEMERRLEILTEEIENIKLGGGGGSGAERKYSIGGYGELIYQNFRGRKQDGTTSGKRDLLDFHRAVLYAGYRFNDWISFNSELEFEHATDSTRGEVSVEQAALDLAPRKWLGFRAGLLLLPVGIINETHEPNTFHGVLRPSVEKNIIPTTWRENGFGVFGTVGMVSYRSYVTAGLQAGNASSVSGFSASSGLRGGRQKGSKSFAEDFAWVGRVDVKPVPGVTLGGSLYAGQADQRQPGLGSVPVSLWDIHGKAKWRGAELTALYVQGHVGNADSVNVAQGIAAGSNGSIGSDFFGGYVEAAFDILSLCPESRGHYLAPFVRYERYDTQKTVPAAWTKNPSNSRIEYTLGLTYRPHRNVAIKFDHQFMRNQGSTGVGQTNAGVGYAF